MMFESLTMFTSMMNDLGNLVGFMLWALVLVDYTFNWVHDRPKEEPRTVQILTTLTGHKLAAGVLIVLAPILFGFVLQYSLVAVGLAVYCAVAYAIRAMIRLNRRLAAIYEKYEIEDPVTNKRGGWA